MILAAAVSIAVSCVNLDDIESRVSKLESKVSELDQLCKNLNGEIGSISSIASVLDGSEVITDIAEIKENGEVVGYAITFSKSGVKKIYNGKNGKDGTDGHDGKSTIFKIEDNKWYTSTDNGEQWTYVGPSTGDPGVPGHDGISPRIKNENGHWWISTDEGQTWTDAGSSVGDPGTPGQDGVSPLIKNENGRWWVSTDKGETWSDAGPSVGDPGKDAPMIGIVPGEGGAYYWTLDGEIIKDNAGNPFSAGGQNGLTPELKIEDGYWYVRYGSGPWTKYGKATGDAGANGTVWTIGENGNWYCDGEDTGKPSRGAGGAVWTIGENGNWYCDGEDTGNPSRGANGTVWTIGENGNWYCDGVDTGKPSQGAPGSPVSGGDSFFSSVNTEGGNLILGLSGGGTIVVPIAGDLSISFATSTSLAATPGATLNINYTITSSTGSADIDVMPTAGLKAKVAENGLRGTITVVVGNSVDFEYDKVTVIVTNGNKTLLKKITFTEGGSIVVTDEHTTSLMTCKGGNVNFKIAANVEYQVSITSGGSPVNWVHHISTRAMTPYSLGFSVDPNTGGRRTATITISSSETEDTAEFTVIQYAATGSFAVTGTGSVSKPVEVIGKTLSGLVVFEEEVEEWSQGVSHTYSDAAAHSAEYFVENATGFSLQNLTDLVNLNVKDF